MKHTYVGIIDYLAWGQIIANSLLMTQIVFRDNNSIFIIFKLLFATIIGINSIVIFIISILRKNKAFLINLAIIALIGIIGGIGRRPVSDEEVWEYRNKIVLDIESENYEAKDGVVYLPDEDIYEKVSDTKRVILAMDGDRTVIYFYENAGMLEDSRGYIYYSDNLDKNMCKDTYEFINIEPIKGNWFSCSTR